MNRVGKCKLVFNLPYFDMVWLRYDYITAIVLKVVHSDDTPLGDVVRQKHEE